MDYLSAHIRDEWPRWSEVMRLVERQHGVITHAQLVDLGLPRHAIKHRVKRGRLHPVGWRGVFAVGRPGLTREGRWMAAVLACGDGAALSHSCAGAHWAFLDDTGLIEVSIQFPRSVRLCDINVHRRRKLDPAAVTVHRDIPVTTPFQTIIDLATCLDRVKLETAINELDRLELLRVDSLRRRLDEIAPVPGVGILKRLLDRRTFTLTDSRLERRFLPIARAANLPPPKTRQIVNGYRVDFYWPELGLVVETDGLRYHRTPQRQARDNRRDQVHTATGLTPLRFSHYEIAFEPRAVETTLRRTGSLLRRRRGV